MGCKLFRIVFFFLFILSIGQSNNQFPKKLWTFWNSLDNLTIFQQLTYKNHQYHAQKNGWQLNVLSLKNYKTWLPEMNIPENILMDKFSDFVRVSLMQKYGGMWFDFTVFPIQDFSWIDRLSKDPDVINSNGQDFDVMMMIGDYGRDSKNIVVENGKTIQLFPGIETAFMLAKPKSQFFIDWKKFLFDCMLNPEETDRVYLQKIDKSNHYLQDLLDIKIGIFQFLCTAQNKYIIFNTYYKMMRLKQHQLDQQAKKTGKPRKYAVNQYKFIALQKDTGFMLYTDFRKPYSIPSNLMKLPYMRNNSRSLKCCIKLFGTQRNQIELILDALLQKPAYVSPFSNPLFFGKYMLCSNQYYITEGSFMEQLVARHMPQLKKKLIIKPEFEDEAYCIPQTIAIIPIILVSLFFLITSIYGICIFLKYGMKPNRGKSYESLSQETIKNEQFDQ